MPVKAGLRQYLRRAFLYPWNLLAFFGASTAAVLSPWPDALMPLIMAAEMAYLGGLVSRPRFRDAVDAELNAQLRQEGSPAQPPPAALNELLTSLPPESRMRFQQLRQRCLEMQRLASGARGRSPLAPGAGDDLRRGNLDRLLWVFLRVPGSPDSPRRVLP